MSVASDAARSKTELTILGALNVILQQRVLIAICTGVMFLIVVVVLLLLPRTWTATSSFAPQSRRAPSGNLAGLAAQFGVVVPGSDPSQSPAFYSDLVLSREILGRVVDSKFVDPAGAASDSVTLVEIFGNKSPRPELRREAAINKLRLLVSAPVSIKTGVVQVAVKTKHPALSYAINARVLALLNDFNQAKRQTQATYERKFVESRLEEVRQNLRQSETRMQEFMERNRNFADASMLKVEQGRLQRDIDQQQQVFTTLAQAFEQARIDEVRDTPLISIIEDPIPPPLADRRRLITRGFIAMLAGFLIGLGLAFARQAVTAGSAGSDDELSRFRTLVRDSALDALRPWRVGQRNRHS